MKSQSGASKRQPATGIPDGSVCVWIINNAAKTRARQKKVNNSGNYPVYVISRKKKKPAVTSTFKAQLEKIDK